MTFMVLKAPLNANQPTCVADVRRKRRLLSSASVFGQIVNLC